MSDIEETEVSKATDEERAEQDLARSDLTLLVLLRDQLQKLRIAEGNRAGASEKLGEPGRQALHEGYEKRLQALEDDITEGVRAEMREHPAWPWLKDIRGVAETSAALVVGYIDIEKCPTVSSLWRYAGYGVVDGRRERPTKGEKLHYNARLKTMVWRLTDLQIKTRGPFRKAYDDAKHRYLTTHGPDSGYKDPYPGKNEGKPWTLAHCELAARRAASKLFLSMLWQVWREAEGLTTQGPWIEQYGGGQHDILDPWEYVRA
jgi:hypothetical protein